jgi:hypothetical protein
MNNQIQTVPFVPQNDFQGRTWRAGYNLILNDIMAVAPVIYT